MTPEDPLLLGSLAVTTYLVAALAIVLVGSLLEEERSA